MTDFDTKVMRKELAKALSQTFDLQSKKVAIYGAGGIAEMSVDPCFTKPYGIEPTYFIDDTPSKHGMLFNGKTIINIDEAQILCKSFFILLCCGSSRVRNIMFDTLRKSPIEGATICTLDEYFYCRHSDEVLAVYDMLEDNLSKATYANMILTRMGKTSQNQNLTVPNQYFGLPEFLCLRNDEIFVDCGAYVGDTVESYLTVKSGMFKKIYAFEPYDMAFHALSARTERLNREWAVSEGRIELIQAGIGDREYQIGVAGNEQKSLLDNNLWGAKVESGGIHVCSIDKFFDEQPITFLKSDIQGFEWKMLAGAEKVIKRDRPLLAICIYHTPCDMYRIALKVKEICPDYFISIRQHGYDCSDTVLYAYCNKI